MNRRRLAAAVFGFLSAVFLAVLAAARRRRMTAAPSKDATQAQPVSVPSVPSPRAAYGGASTTDTLAAATGETLNAN